jgi:hypothetical protein
MWTRTTPPRVVTLPVLQPTALPNERAAASVWASRVVSRTTEIDVAPKRDAHGNDHRSDGDRNERAARHVEKRSDQVRSISEHDRKHRAEDRGHQGRDDHGPDHGRRGVGSDPRRGDNGC